MPVRTLLERSRHVTQAIKPCFMMSPLAVSQYLPADLRFDVVIFDEASQVTPGDAINCIYRGDALILAGDQKQLPPTNFFAAALTDDEDEWSEDSDDAADFESILDLAKASGAYRSLTLRWHYRSLHEALIAFSNAAFYEGQLVTFPSRHSDGPDVGVELFHVRRHLPARKLRGTTRSRPRRVAERVLHHLRHPPGPQPRRGDVQRGPGRRDRGRCRAGPATGPRRTWTGSSRDDRLRRLLRQEPRDRPGRRARRA